MTLMETKNIFKNHQEYKDKCAELGMDPNLKIVGGAVPYKEGGYESTLFRNKETFEITCVEFAPYLV